MKKLKLFPLVLCCIITAVFCSCTKTPPPPKPASLITGPWQDQLKAVEQEIAYLQSRKQHYTLLQERADDKSWDLQTRSNLVSREMQRYAQQYKDYIYSIDMQLQKLNQRKDKIIEEHKQGLTEILKEHFKPGL